MMLPYQYDRLAEALGDIRPPIKRQGEHQGWYHACITVARSLSKMDSDFDPAWFMRLAEGKSDPSTKELLSRPQR